MEKQNDKKSSTVRKRTLPNGVMCLLIILFLFGGIGWKMGVAPMLNTIMHTAHTCCSTHASI